MVSPAGCNPVASAWRFDSSRSHDALVAQRIERLSPKQEVAGSTPVEGTHGLVTLPVGRTACKAGHEPVQLRARSRCHPLWSTAGGPAPGRDSYPRHAPIDTEASDWRQHAGTEQVRLYRTGVLPSDTASSGAPSSAYFTRYEDLPLGGLGFETPIGVAHLTTGGDNFTACTGPVPRQRVLRLLSEWLQVRVLSSPTTGT